MVFLQFDLKLVSNFIFLFWSNLWSNRIPFAFKSPLKTGIMINDVWTTVYCIWKNIYAMECNHQMKNPLIKFGQRVKFFFILHSWQQQRAAKLGHLSLSCCSKAFGGFICTFSLLISLSFTFQLSKFN